MEQKAVGARECETVYGYEEEEGLMIEQLVAEGVHHLQDGNLEAAIERFDAVLDSRPSAEIFYYRGVAHDMAWEPEKAIRDLSRCIEMDPENTRALYSRSLVHRAGGSWKESLADARRAHELEPDDFRCANAYAQVLLETPEESDRDPKRAEVAALKACTTTEFRDPVCLETLANALEQLGQTEKAEEVRSMLGQSDVQEIHFPELVQEVLGYFSNLMGKAPETISLQEIVPVLPEGVSIRTITAPEGCDFHLLFSVGMSQRAMQVPEGVGAAYYGYAEVCLRIPADWQVEPDLQNRAQAWPWVWLRVMALQAHLKGIWLSGGPTLFPPPDQLEPLWPDSQYAGFLLLPGADGVQGFPSRFGMFVHVLTAVPITLAEYRLVADDGLKALFRKFEEKGVELRFMPERESVV
jgi:tetratricopeptide (TPR) repeat protein